MDKAHKRVSGLGKVLSSLQRIAFYRVIRGAIKAVTQAFQEGAENAYWYSKTIGDQTKYIADAYDNLASGSFKMSNQLGAAWATLKATLEPILMSIINLVTQAANAITQLFAILGGRTTYLKAIDYSKEWAETTAKGAGAAKEWKNQLMGFDEINRLEEPSSGGGGGGGGLPDYENMFEEREVEGIFARIAAKFKDLKNSLNFEPLIQSWDRFKESVQGFVDVVMRGLSWAWDNILVPLAHWTIETAAPAVLNLLATAFDFLTAALERLSPVFKWAWDNIFKPMAEFVGTAFINTIQTITKELEKLIAVLRGDVSFKDWIKQLTPAEEILLAIAAAVVTVHTALGVFNAMMTISTALTGGFSAALAFLAANPIAIVVAAIAGLIVIGIELYKHWDEIITKIREFGDRCRENFGNGKLEFSDFARLVIGEIEAVIAGIQWLIGWIQQAIEWFNNLNFVRNANARAQQAWESGSIWNGMNFASGGHPASGQLFIAREAGPELVGTMGGRPTVATNADIVEGIKEGVFEAVASAMGGGGGTPVEIYLDGRQIASTTTKYQRQFARANG